MIRVRTLLAVWLILAVPAAGVAAVAPAADCGDHETAGMVHEGHGEHAGHTPETIQALAECDCPCDALDCSTVLTLEVAPDIPEHGAPAGVWTESAATAGVIATAPDAPFRPPISI